jgi:hypothetical protein
MSDLDVIRALDAMERLLQEQDLPLEVLPEWQKTYAAAMASADRGPGWDVIMDRAHALGKRLDQAADTLSVKRDEIKRELDLKALGSRALKGYKPF